MRVRQLLGVISKPVTVKLATQTFMGAAMGLGPSLLLRAIDPSFFGSLVRHQPALTWAFVGIVVGLFAAGATLTGVLFLTEDNES